MKLVKIILIAIFIALIPNIIFAQQHYILYPNQQIVYPYNYTYNTYNIQPYQYYYIAPNYQYSYGYNISYPSVIINYDDRPLNLYPVYIYRPQLQRRFFNYGHYYYYKY